MRRRSFMISAAVMAGLALGVIFGPSLSISTASAQTNPPAQTQAASPFDSLRTLFLDKLAAALNIQRSALDSAIITAGNSTADEAVTAGTLTQAQADALKADVQAGGLDALWGGHGGRGGRGDRDVAGVKSTMFDAAAKTLNITTDELRTQLSSGQTIAQLAAAHGTTEQAVVDAALAAAKTQLDAAVTAGTLTQAQADTQYARLQQEGADLLSHRGGPRGDRGARPAAPTATTTPDA